MFESEPIDSLVDVSLLRQFLPLHNDVGPYSVLSNHPIFYHLLQENLLSLSIEVVFFAFFLIRAAKLFMVELAAVYRILKFEIGV